MQDCRFLPPKDRYHQWRSSFDGTTKNGEAPKHPQDIEIDDYGFTIIDLTNVGHKDEPWVLPATVA
jgi:hypothetical protein